MGSSPQVRGRPMDEYTLSERTGLIPAGAGQTTALTVSMCSDHGSSPQVRGRHPPSKRRGARPGLIPAGAGQTGVDSRPGKCRGAHPRRCGADDLGLVIVGILVGSSPQVRGRPLATSNVALAIGHSGTTTSSPSECTPPMRGVMKPTFYYGSSLLCRARVKIILHPSSSGCASILISKKWVSGSFFCYSSP